MSATTVSVSSRNAPSRSRASRFALLAIILLAFGLRMFRIERQSLWWDESLSLYRAQRDIPFILSNHIDFPGMETTDQHPPLYFLVLHGFVRGAGEHDMVLRLPSVLFATLIVPLLYVLSRRLYGERVALLAALLVALSPFHLWYAQEARMYTMVTALVLLATYALWRALAERRWPWGAVAFAAMACAVATQYLALLMLAVQAVFCIVWVIGRRASLSHARDKRRWVLRPRHGLWLAPVGIGLLVMLVIFWDHIQVLMVTLRAGRVYVPLDTILLDVLNSYSLGLSVSFGDVWPLDVAFLLIYLLGVSTIWWRYPLGRSNVGDASGRRAGESGLGAQIVLLVGSIALPIALIWLFSLLRPIYMNSRYLMMASPMFYLGLALGVGAIARYRRYLAVLALVIVVAGMGYSTHRFFYHDHYASKEDYASAAEKIVRHEQLGDLIVVNGAESLTAFNHYYRGSLDVVSMPVAGSSVERVDREMAALADTHDRLWVLHGRRALTDPGRHVLGWVERNTYTVMNVGFPSNGFYLRLSARLSEHPIQESSLDAVVPIGRIDENLALLDYEVRYAAPDGTLHRVTATVSDRAWESDAGLTVDGEIAAGTNLSLHLDWEPRAELPDLKMSLRLVDPHVIWAQRDRVPFQNLSTIEWPVGSRVRQDALLPIPLGTPPGRYHLQLWVYDRSEETPFSFRDEHTGWVQPYIELGGVDVARSQSEVASHEFVPEDVSPLGRATYGGALDLLACEAMPISSNDARSLLLTTYWRHRPRTVVRWPSAGGAVSTLDDYDLVANLVDESGSVWTSESARPAGDTYPTTQWREGECVRGVCRLSIPHEVPPGDYAVHLLLRSRRTGELLWMQRGLLPWSGHDVRVAEIALD